MHPKMELGALTVLTQVQFGQAPAIEGLLEDGAGVPVTHGVQIHGLVLHHVLQPQDGRQSTVGRGRETESTTGGNRNKGTDQGAT